MPAAMPAAESSSTRQRSGAIPRCRIAAGIAAGARVVGVAVGNFHGQDHSAAHDRVQTLHDLTDARLAALFGGAA